MKSPRIITPFYKLSDANLELKAQEIVLAMTENTNFLTPVPTLPLIVDAIGTYSDALTAAQDRGRVHIAEKNDARNELEIILKQLSTYVTMTADGSKTILISSGFDLAKDGEPLPPLGPPQNVRVKSGINPATIEVKIERVKGATSYVYEHIADPVTETSQWTTEANTRGKNVFTGLEQGKKYWFRVGAIGPRQQKAYSIEIACIVQ